MIRDRRRYGLLEGDLVQVRNMRDDNVMPTGIVLKIYDSNMYEGASAEVLVRGSHVTLCEVRWLSILEHAPDSLS
jgi:hypothetical protein|tara:strand:+ start:126 stop:350 length:225 start_codon:yes stop_codon:yes gene_type:complete